MDWGLHRPVREYIMATDTVEVGLWVRAVSRESACRFRAASGVSADRRDVLVEGFDPMRGSMRHRRRRKYRVGARTVNFTSVGLVASAIVVVLEVTAPSSAPPGVFSFPAQADHPVLPTLPLQAAAPAAVQQSLLGDRTSMSTPSASSVALGVVSRSASSADAEFPTTAVPAAAQPSGAIVAALGRLDHGAGHGSGTGSRVERAGVAATGAPPHASPNADLSDGNGNSGNGASANGHGNADSFKSEPIGPTVPDTLVSPVQASATAPSEGGPAPDPEAIDPSSRGFGQRRPATAGLGGGEGQDEYPAATPGRTSPPRR